MFKLKIYLSKTGYHVTADDVTVTF